MPSNANNVAWKKKKTRWCRNGKKKNDKVKCRKSEYASRQGVAAATLKI